MTLLTLLRTLSLGYFRQHRLRTALVVLSIALGVATLVATQALNRGLKAGVQGGINPLAGLSDLLISNGQAGVSAELADELMKAAIEGVDSCDPFVLWRVSLADLNNKQVWLIGLNWSGPGKLAAPGEDNPLGVRVERLPVLKSPLELAALLLYPPILVSEHLYGELLARDPKTRRVRLRNAGQTPQLTVMGTLRFDSDKVALGRSDVVVAQLADASAVCFPERPGTVHHIGVRLAAGADAASTRERIASWLDGRADVLTVDASQQLVSDVTSGLEIGLAVGGLVALVVGLFLVYNALSVSVAERRHDIGILRSMGATRRQIARLFVGEAFVLGLLGSGLGLPLGWWLAWMAIRPMSAVITDLLVPVENARVHLPAWLVGVALIAGTLVAVLAALLPAMHAASEEPADAVRRAPRKHPVLIAFLQGGAAVLLILLGLALAGFRDQLPTRLGTFGGVVCLVLGGLVATPLLASLVGRLVQPFFRHFLGLEGRLAADNLVRAPGRTGLVIAALAATSGLLVQTAGFLKSTREAIRVWVDDKVAADLFVTSGSAVTSGGSLLTMNEGLQAKLAALPGVETVMPVRFLRLDYASPIDGQKRITFAVGIDAQAFLDLRADRPLARDRDVYRTLQSPGKVVVSRNFASLYGKNVGDTITIPGRGRPLTVEIVGLTTDYTWNRGTIFMDRRWLREEYGDRQIDVYDLFLAPGASPEAVRASLLARYGNDEALFVISRPELHQEVHATLQRVYALAYAQQLVVGLVALLGVVSALFISVLQRRRELGLLRAVGATRAQILRSVLAEAILMGLVGALIGFGIGLLLEWYVLDILLLDESGFDFPLRVPWGEAGIVCLGSIVCATLAGLWPAYHATTLRIPEAIAYE